MNIFSSQHQLGLHPLILKLFTKFFRYGNIYLRRYLYRAIALETFLKFSKIVNSPPIKFIRNKIILHQMPLKSAKGTKGKFGCESQTKSYKIFLQH